jgi:hypothetical protein
MTATATQTKIIVTVQGLDDNSQPVTIEIPVATDLLVGRDELYRECGLLIGEALKDFYSAP